MTRRRRHDGAGEPLLGEDWWADDQQLFQDSVTRRTAPARRPRQAAAASRPPIVGLIHAAGRKPGDRVHAAAGARAPDRTVTEPPGSLGLSGRRYNDPRFDARLQNARARRPGRDSRHE